MRHSLPLTPQFYVTAPQDCPYLDNRKERKLFTALQGENAELLNNALSKQGFRRSQNVLYRPSCSDCCACLSARIRVADFTPSKSQKRVLKRNAHLKHRSTSPWATEEQFALFRRYLDSRHATGGMAEMDIFEFAAMVEETPIKTRLIEFSDPQAARETEMLKAVCLTDVLDDGLSMVYSFFDPDMTKYSLGTYIILAHIELAQDLGLPYVYLGYWVPNSPKMGYKSKFNALEVFVNGAWEPMEDPKAYEITTDPLTVQPIAEQVARLSIPDTRL